MDGEEYLFQWIVRGVALSKEIGNSNSVQQTHKSPLQIKDVFYILDSFNDCAAYLKSRREKVRTFEMNSEAPVQDLLFVMLKPVFPDLTFEDPSAKSAASYAIKDLYIPSLKLVLEAKYIGSRGDVKLIEKQLADDIWKYSSNLDCEELIFFIYDPLLCISDRRNFIKKMSRSVGEFINNGRQILIKTKVCP